MEINLKDTLKALRQQKQITQETLAQYLGISQQSVGKWERGEGFSDITLLPKIALYFNVSIDDLLNVGQARVEERIRAYVEQSKVFEKNGDVEARIALWERAHEEFPNHLFVMERLKTALSVRCPWPYPRDTGGRIVALAERILDESTDTKLRESAIFSLCSVYTSWGETEKALCYADLCGSMYHCRESMRASVLEGEAGIKESQNCLLNYVFCAAQEAIDPKHYDFGTEEEVRCIRFSIDLMKLLFSDGNYGGYAFDLSHRYFLMARSYAWMGNSEKTLDALEECVRFCVMDAQNKEGTYTAPMINRLEYGKDFSKNFKGNACNARLEVLGAQNCFDFVRSHEKFQKLEQTLREYAEKV